MFIYILVFLLIVLNVYRYDIRGKKKNKHKSFCGIIFFLFIVAGLRYHIGIDTVRYELGFEQIQPLLGIKSNNIDWTELSQPLWFSINSFFRSFSDNFVFVQLFHSAIFHTLLARFILKLCTKPFMALGVIYCVAWWNFSFEIMRESLCVVVYLNSLFYLKEKKIKQYVLSAIISMGIHWFSFVVFFITPLVYLCKRQWLFIFIVFFGVSIFIIDASGIADIINKLTAILGSNAGNRVISYIESDTYGVISLSILGIIFIFLTQILYPIVVSNYLSKSFHYMLFSKVLLLYIIFVILRMKILIFDRFSNYLVVLLIVCTINVLADTVKYRMEKLPKLYLYFSILFFAFQGVYSFVSPSALELRSNIKYDCRYIPYKTVFQDPDIIREDLYDSYIVY